RAASLVQRPSWSPESACASGAPPPIRTSVRCPLYRTPPAYPYGFSRSNEAIYSVKKAHHPAPRITRLHLMIAALHLSGKAERTQDAYVRAVRLLAQFYHKAPARISE